MVIVVFLVLVLFLLLVVLVIIVVHCPTLSLLVTILGVVVIVVLTHVGRHVVMVVGFHGCSPDLLLSLSSIILIHRVIRLAIIFRIGIALASFFF